MPRLATTFLMQVFVTLVLMPCPGSGLNGHRFVSTGPEKGDQATSASRSGDALVSGLATESVRLAGHLTMGSIKHLRGSESQGWCDHTVIALGITPPIPAIAEAERETVLMKASGFLDLVVGLEDVQDV